MSYHLYLLLLRPGPKPMGEVSNLMDSMAALQHPLMGMPMPPIRKNDVSMWQQAPEAGKFKPLSGEKQVLCNSHCHI